MPERTLPKGRTTARRSGGRRVRLFEQTASTNPTVKRLEAAYLASLAAIDAVEDHHAKSRTDKRLTPEGVVDEITRYALSEAVPVLHRARAEVRRAKAEANELRAKIKMPAPDDSDLAGAMRRIQIRSVLLAMAPDKRAEYVNRHLEKMTPEVAMAITELPPEFSGVPPSQYAMITESLIDSRCGADRQHLEEIEHAIEAAESAVEGARLEVGVELGIFDQAKFNELAEPIEAKTRETSFVAPPWLRRKNRDGAEQIVVVDLEKQHERLANDDEIATGVYATDFDDYQAKKAAAWSAA